MEGSRDIQELESYARILEASGHFRVLRRLPDLPTHPETKNDAARVAVILDTETTGLDWSQDEIIELGAIAVTYDSSGMITGFVDWFSELREPSVSVSDEITQITGISTDMLRGKVITKEQLDSFFGAADLLIAHNAGFDRPFCEAISPIFRSKPWACSATEIDWKSLGFDGAKLSYLATCSGWFYDAHRALDDCKALLQVLSTPISKVGDKTPFSLLLESAREIRTRISLRAPFTARNLLRSKGFRWKPATDVQPGEWYIEVSEDETSEALRFLRSSRQVDPSSIRTARLSAYERYRQ